MTYFAGFRAPNRPHDRFVSLGLLILAIFCKFSFSAPSAGRSVYHSHFYGSSARTEAKSNEIKRSLPGVRRKKPPLELHRAALDSTAFLGFHGAHTLQTFLAKFHELTIIRTMEGKKLLAAAAVPFLIAPRCRLLRADDEGT